MARRGISPVVAVLILIVIAVVAAIAVFGFIQGFVAQTMGSSEAPSNIVIDAAFLTNSSTVSNNVTAVVRNTGDFNTTVIAVYVLDPDDLSVIALNTTLSETVPANDVTQVSTNVSVVTGTTVESGEFYVVKVVTEDGASASIRVKAD